MTMKRILFYPSFTRRLRNAEHYDFYGVIDNHILTLVLKPVMLVPIWETFHNTFMQEDNIYKRFLRKEDTRLVNEAHKERKKAHRALGLVIETGLYSDLPAIQTAAESLVRVVKNYPYISRAPMTEASAMIVNLIQDLRLPKYAPSVTLIGADEAVERLKHDNETFMTLYAERAYEEEGEKDEGSLSAIRGVTDREFANLTEAINVFYRINEMQHPKDPEVSETLAGIIRFINSYIHQYETIYSRRNPNYRADHDKPSSPGEDLPGDEPTEPVIPEFSISGQETLGSSTVMPGYGTQMSLRAVDAQAFADVLYPIARDGILRLVWPESGRGDNFPVADFLFDADGTTPVGLVVDAPAEWAIYKPFSGSGEVMAEVVKDDLVLAILLGVQFPAMMGED